MRTRQRQFEPKASLTSGNPQLNAPSERMLERKWACAARGLGHLDLHTAVAVFLRAQESTVRRARAHLIWGRGHRCTLYALQQQVQSSLCEPPHVVLPARVRGLHENGAFDRTGDCDDGEARRDVGHVEGWPTCSAFADAPLSAHFATHAPSDPCRQLLLGIHVALASTSSRG